MLKNHVIVLAILILSCTPCFAVNGAQFISQSAPPTAMNISQTYSVSVIFKNTGTTTWTESAGYRLGVQNPPDNGNWVTGRVYLAAGESIAPGQSKTFSFNITSSITPGKHNFQWRMVQENVQWFGDYSTNVVVYVKHYALMDRVKKKGCVWDGVFSGYGGDTDNSIVLLDRSECEYLHRSIETWAWPPDFNSVQANMNKVQRTNVIYSVNIAEAISTTATYYYPDESRDFNFAAMCAPGTTGKWGSNTCIPSLKTAEYRKYLKYITHKFIDMGVQDFAFGQIYLQEDTSQRTSISNPIAPSIALEMRQYAQSKGKEIIIGAQSNDISDESYLRNFDYIFGGVGEDASGNIENIACSSQWSGCWALLWNDAWALKANDVLLHFDWYSACTDDMDTFAHMSSATKEQFLRDKYAYFTQTKNMGFLMPFLAVLCGSGAGCYGPNVWAYSPDNRYSCKDEDIMNYMMSGASSVTVSGMVKKNTGQGIGGVLIDMCAGLSAQTDSSGRWSKNVSFGQAYCARIASGLPGSYTAIAGVNNTYCNTNAASYEWQYAGKDVFQNCSYSDQRAWDLPAAKDAGINFIVYYPTTTTTTTTNPTTTTTTTSTTRSTTTTTTTTTSTTLSSTTTTMTASSTTSSTTSTTSTTTSSTSRISSTTTITSFLSTTSSSTTSTTRMYCVMPGNSPPCDEASLSEVVLTINQWTFGGMDLVNVLGLINSWADPVTYPPA